MIHYFPFTLHRSISDDRRHPVEMIVEGVLLLGMMYIDLNLHNITTTTTSVNNTHVIETFVLAIPIGGCHPTHSHSSIASYGVPVHLRR